MVIDIPRFNKSFRFIFNRLFCLDSSKFDGFSSRFGRRYHLFYLIANGFILCQIHAEHGYKRLIDGINLRPRLKDSLYSLTGLFALLLNSRQKPIWMRLDNSTDETSIPHI